VGGSYGVASDWRHSEIVGPLRNMQRWLPRKEELVYTSKLPKNSTRSSETISAQV
jgi:hypothetical protein